MVMSINDPFIGEYLSRRETWIVKRGRETFYNEKRMMIEFNSFDEARIWTLLEFDQELFRSDPSLL